MTKHPINQLMTAPESIFNHLREGFILINLDRRIMLANQTAREIFELGDRSLDGLPVGEVIKINGLSNMLDAPLSPAARTYEFNSSDGSIFNLSISEVPEIGYALLLHDISGLKNINQVKSDFVTTVSHDLRSPLTAIVGYVDLLKHVGSTNTMQDEFISRIQTSLTDITRLVDDLLNLDRIESGLDSTRELVEMDEMVRYVVNANLLAANQKHLDLTIHFNELLPKIRANKMQIQQLVENLVTNMIKYTPEGGSLTISGEAQHKQLILNFTDTGIGIPFRDVPHIFDRFYRASNVNECAGGSGLGLSIVKSILDRHGGRIWVESETGRGSTFSVILPLGELQSE